MITCPNCGTANEPGNRFCKECGADLSSLKDASSSTRSAPSRSEPTSSPTRAEPEQTWERRIVPPTELPPTAPEWKMSDPGPLPDPPRRRKWLWITVGLIGALLLCCCIFLIWANTAGEEFINDLSTRVSREATENADR